jgi:RNA polymerase sigma-70 factor (ECF subfamily)
VTNNFAAGRSHSRREDRVEHGWGQTTQADADHDDWNLMTDSHETDGQTADAREVGDGQAQDRRSALAHEFERHRPHLRRVGYRMLGSMADAEDALQECWLRLDRRPPEELGDLRPWLTTVTGRICLDMLRARRSRREGLSGSWLPEPVVVPYDSPEEDTVRADSVGLALLVVLEALSPSERLAFVLHDVFAVPFDEIAPIVGRSSEASRQLASRARRRVRLARSGPDVDLATQRRIVESFLAASRHGDFEALLALLDPDVVLHMDVGDRPQLAQPPISGARQVAEFLRSGAPLFAPLCRPAIVNGGAGFVVGPSGRTIGVVGLTVVGGRIREVDIVADPAKLARLDRIGG